MPHAENFRIEDDVVGRLKKLENAIKKICEVAGTPGISLGVSYQGKIVYRASYGFSDVENQKLVDSDTVFPLGTMAKTFTAAAIGILVDEGKLKWNTRIKDVIPELDTRSKTVTDNLTIVDLLCHRAGLGKSNFWWQGAEASLLLKKEDLIPFYNTLPAVGEFRADWSYSNWGYAVAGEVIERLSGLTYGDFLSEKIYKPLGLKNTSVKSLNLNETEKMARPYAAMDDASLHLLPQPPVNESTIMAPAMGGVSSANDLLTYNMALLQAQRHESGVEKATFPPVLKNALMHLSGHIFTAKATLEKSYAFGWYRTQLPNNVLGMGWNSIYVKKMPKIIPRGHVGPLIAHGGSLPGYHVAMALLPEINSSVVVCTNSIALGDVSGWVSMALVEALIDTPEPSDFVAHAMEAAHNNALNVHNFSKKLDEARAPGTLHRSLVDYVGKYQDKQRDWFIDIKKKGPDRLEVAFLGLKSQTWTLTHYEHDTFIWLASREEQAKRGRMVTYPLVPNHFKLVFVAGRDGSIEKLYWAHEAGVPVEQQVFSKLM